MQCSKRARLLDHLVGAGKQQWRNRKAERPGGLQIDGQLEPGWLLHWELRQRVWSAPSEAGPPHRRSAW